jgi:V/A-type H+-transporting ATPase subunit E
MALSDITQKILDDAKKDAKELLLRTKKDVSRIEKDTKVKIEDLKQEQKQQLESIFAQAKQERISLYKQKIKNLIDGKKRALLDGVFNKALDQMSSISKKDHEAYVKKSLGNVPKGLQDVTVWVGEQHEKYLRPLIENQLKNVSVQVSPDVQIGCIVQGSDFEFDMTFENQLQSKKKELEVEVASILFADAK